MYETHYNLTGRPFGLTPDPRFWYETATHKKAMAYLGYGLSQGEGFIVITGDVGAGKTTLMGHLTAGIDREQLNVITIVSTQIAADDMLRIVCAGLDVDHTGLTKAAMLGAIEHGLHACARTGRRTLLVVDEAQALPIESLEELRMLSNFQAGGHALLQIFLLGQPEFRDRLQDPRLDQLRQRVIAIHHLSTMAADEVGPYLAHRLSVAGAGPRPAFLPKAAAEMHRWSGGVPRRLNQLASRMLLLGAIEGIERFTAEDAIAVAADVDADAETIVAAPKPEPVVAAPAPAPAVATPAPPAPRPVVAPPRPVAAAAPVAAPPPAPAAVDNGSTLRIFELEKRLEDQDAALRRVLTLLVDWVEGDGPRPDLASLRDRVA